MTVTSPAPTQAPPQAPQAPQAPQKQPVHQHLRRTHKHATAIVGILGAFVTIVGQVAALMEANAQAASNLIGSQPSGPIAYTQRPWWRRGAETLPFSFAGILLGITMTVYSLCFFIFHLFFSTLIGRIMLVLGLLTVAAVVVMHVGGWWF